VIQCVKFGTERKVCVFQVLWWWVWVTSVNVFLGMVYYFLSPWKMPWWFDLRSGNWKKIRGRRRFL